MFCRPWVTHASSDHTSVGWQCVPNPQYLPSDLQSGYYLSFSSHYDFMKPAGFTLFLSASICMLLFPKGNSELVYLKGPSPSGLKQLHLFLKVKKHLGSHEASTIHWSLVKFQKAHFSSYLCLFTDVPGERHRIVCNLLHVSNGAEALLVVGCVRRRTAGGNLEVLRLLHNKLSMSKLYS